MPKFLTFNNGKELRVGTFYCVGRNFADHAKEMNAEIPSRPLIFIKPSSAYLADGGMTIIPNISNCLHHEVEVVLTIGKNGKNISEEESLDYISGIGIGIDFTLRDVQAELKKKGEPWAVAKGFATSAPLSNIVPISNINLDNYLEFALEVNGEIRQQGNTKNMLFSFSKLISYLSSVFELEEGDVIFTGTPEGVSEVKSGDKLKAYIKNLVELNISIK